MKYDSRIPEAAHRLYIVKDGEFSVTELSNIIPPGWQHFIEFILHLTERIESCKIISYKIDKGLLRIKGKSPYKLDEFIFESTAQNIAKLSGFACIVCGIKAPRRKAQDKWPCLCTEHYIQFANWIALKINPPASGSVEFIEPNISNGG